VHAGKLLMPAVPPKLYCLRDSRYGRGGLSKTPLSPPRSSPGPRASESEISHFRNYVRSFTDPARGFPNCLTSIPKALRRFLAGIAAPG
jgi:hypothetical protein